MQKQRRWLRQFYSGAIEKPLFRPAAGESKEEADRAQTNATSVAAEVAKPAIVTVDTPLSKHSGDSAGDSRVPSGSRRANGNSSVDDEDANSAKNPSINVAKKTTKGRKSTGAANVIAEVGSGATTRKRVLKKPIDMDF